jgi:hypothetical protein
MFANLGRKVLAVVCGLVSAWGTIILGKMIATDAGYAEPAGLEYMNRGEIAVYSASQPTAVYVTLLISSVIGAFFGGHIVTNMSRRESPGLTLTLVVAVFLILGGLVNFFMLLPGQPAWLIVATLVSYIPVPIVGHIAARAEHEAGISSIPQPH